LPSVSDLAERGLRLPVEQGLVVYQIVPNGAAQRAGLRGVTADGSIGDIITAVDGQKMKDLDDLYRLLDKKQIGETVQVELFRDGKTVTVPLKLMPSSQTTTPTRRRGME
jgi:S1-C subfamily serine protease